MRLHVLFVGTSNTRNLSNVYSIPMPVAIKLLDVKPYPYPVKYGNYPRKLNMGIPVRFGIFCYPSDNTYYCLGNLGAGNAY